MLRGEGEKSGLKHTCSYHLSYSGFLSDSGIFMCIVYIHYFNYTAVSGYLLILFVTNKWHQTGKKGGNYLILLFVMFVSI